MKNLLTTPFAITAVCGVLLAARAAVPPPEQILASDTLAVLAIPDYSRMLESQKTAPYFQLWRDESMRPFRDKFVAKFTKEFIEPMERQLGLKMADYLDLARGQITLAVTRNGWNGTAEPLPGFIALIDTREKSELLAKNLGEVRKKLTESGQTLKSERIRDVEFTSLPVEVPDGPKFQLSFGQAGPVLVVGTATADLERVVARLAGGGSQPLAELPAFDKNYQSLFRAAESYGWINFTQVNEVLTQVITGAAAASGGDSGASGKIIENLGLNGLKTLASASRSGSDGAEIEMAMTVPADLRRGLFKLIATEGKDSSPPSFVPSDAISFSRWRIDGQKFWDTLDATIGEMTGGTVNTFFIAPINEAGKQKDPNFDLRRSVIGNLGDDVVSYQKAPRGVTLEALNNQPALTLIGTANGEQLIQSLRTLVAALGSNPMLAGAAGSLEFKEREFLGKKIHSLPLPATEGAEAAERNIMFCASGGFLAISLDAAILEEYLRSSETKPKPLSETPGLANAAQKVGGMATGLFGFQNDLENMRVLYELAKANEDLLATVMAASPLAESLPPEERQKALKEWFDFSLLPPFDRISKYFGISVYGGRMSADGYSMKIFTPTPTGIR
ncbi:MAG: hypothetical protein ACYC23_04030 [Limisphaerales bacterium]